MKTEHFILEQDGLYWVKDMPDDELDESEHITSHIARTRYIEKLIACAIPVSNSREVELEIISEFCGDLTIGEIYTLQCEVKIKVDCTQRGCIGECGECEHLIKVAFVKLKEETKETPIKELEAVTKEEISEEEIIKMIKLEYDKYKDSSYVDVLKTISKVLLSNFTITKRQ